MSYLKHRLTALFTLFIAAGLAVVSYWSSAPGYEFPKIVALVLIAISLLQVLLAMVPKKPITVANEESIPWGSILPVLLILVIFLLVAEWLGFFISSFIAFSLIVLVYIPERWSWRRVIRSCAIAATFMGVLYAVFVTLLGVQIPQGILI